MAIRVDIPPDQLAELMELLGAKTKKEAATYAVSNTLQILRQREAERLLREERDVFLLPEEAVERHRDLD